MKKRSIAAVTLALVGTSAYADRQPQLRPNDKPTAVSNTPATSTVLPAQTRPARVMMLRWFTSDVARAEKFYQAVFGMTTVQRMGANVRIMMFPGGALPGMILVQTAEPNHLKGSFVAQVADVKATLATAAANGGKLLNTRFSQNVEGQQANSSHFEDPDGNVVEVLQMAPSKN